MAKRIIHYPRLDTILQVEKTIKKAKDPLSKNELDRRLPKQIMRPTLNVILDYLSESGKIATLKEGIIWIHIDDASKRLKDAIKKGTRVS
ncbi:hypothetical protein COV93_00110 [Candidatus Woesearchaeota archaeon CG11_big_fil_rev_8_21_14_0_20_43_8]|nr:MAG: hypothetical protein COV93_00110 [Candidatus Woesearchaeota archaeon CG11_big_fil_rev_8_21_14_0_20_43_8]PIO05254.1 MAG: hypothetical protein COT47_05575 [Candidatus Woesearchaeota archaeon CG08_land_8_20_14_0_20_43_7]